MKKTIQLLQSKWREYLIEVIVIIVGILLAIALNNWNEERKNKKIEKEILISIREGLSTDIEETIAINITGFQRRATLVNAIVKAAETGDLIPDSLQKDYIYMSYSLGFRPITTPYNFLESKGLDIISNEKIRTAIINLYNIEYKLIHDRFDNYLNNLRDVHRPSLRKHFRIYPPDAPYRYVPVNYPEMLSDRGFLNSLAVMASNSSSISRLLGELIIKINEVIEDIDKELKQF